MDPVQHLPIEIVIEILSYVEPTDLVRCCLVSKKWHRVVSNTNGLWKRFCDREHFRLEDYVIQRGGGGDVLPWAQLYKKGKTHIRNWETNRKTVYDIVIQRLSIATSDGDYFFGASSEGSISVFNIQTLNPSPIQIIHCAPFSSPVRDLEVNSHWLICTSDFIIVFFERDGATYSLRGCLRVRQSEGEEDEEDLVEFSKIVEVVNRLKKFSAAGLVGSRIWLQIGNTVEIWNGEDKVTSIQGASGLRCTSNGGYLFLSYENQLHAFDQNGNPLFEDAHVNLYSIRCNGSVCVFFYSTHPTLGLWTKIQHKWNKCSDLLLGLNTLGHVLHPHSNDLVVLCLNSRACPGVEPVPFPSCLVWYDLTHPRKPPAKYSLVTLKLTYKSQMIFLSPILLAVQFRSYGGFYNDLAVFKRQPNSLAKLYIIQLGISKLFHLSPKAIVLKEKEATDSVTIMSYRI